MKARRTKSAPAPAFWDTSALLLLICRQPKSPRARATQRSYPAINVWWGAEDLAKELKRKLPRMKSKGEKAEQIMKRIWEEERGER
jgi:hypothetical protein